VSGGGVKENEKLFPEKLKKLPNQQNKNLILFTLL
jgi:hypothetical protein